ncbi:hypothetical protein SESBI_32810 [Sesbania bispinosa]|nr:hypothetical protein SESBI_32810 [Sesbania bispinosa]
MNEESDFILQFQAKSSAELLRKYRVKVEKIENMKKSKDCISKQDQRKKSLAGRDAAQALASTQIEDKMQDQRKQSLASRSVA